jgi:hypothetical protein
MMLESLNKPMIEVAIILDEARKSPNTLDAARLCMKLELTGQ